MQIQTEINKSIAGLFKNADASYNDDDWIQRFQKLVHMLLNLEEIPQQNVFNSLTTHLGSMLKKSNGELKQSVLMALTHLLSKYAIQMKILCDILISMCISRISTYARDLFETQANTMAKCVVVASKSKKANSSEFLAKTFLDIISKLKTLYQDMSSQTLMSLDSHINELTIYTSFICQILVSSRFMQVPYDLTILKEIIQIFISMIDQYEFNAVNLSKLKSQENLPLFGTQLNHLLLILAKTIGNQSQLLSNVSASMIQKSIILCYSSKTNKDIAWEKSILCVVDTFIAENGVSFTSHIQTQVIEYCYRSLSLENELNSSRKFMLKVLLRLINYGSLHTQDLQRIFQRLMCFYLLDETSSFSSGFVDNSLEVRLCYEILFEIAFTKCPNVHLMDMCIQFMNEGLYDIDYQIRCTCKKLLSQASAIVHPFFPRAKIPNYTESIEPKIILKDTVDIKQSKIGKKRYLDENQGDDGLYGVEKKILKASETFTGSAVVIGSPAQENTLQEEKAGKAENHVSLSIEETKKSNYHNQLNLVKIFEVPSKSNDVNEKVCIPTYPRLHSEQENEPEKIDDNLELVEANVISNGERQMSVNEEDSDEPLPEIVMDGDSTDEE